MNDPLYDLAGLGYLLDDEGKKLLRTSYFGDSTEESRNELEEMIAVFLCWNLAWSLVHVDSNQLGSTTAGLPRSFLISSPDRSELEGGLADRGHLSYCHVRTTSYLDPRPRVLRDGLEILLRAAARGTRHLQRMSDRHKSQ